MYHLSSTTPPGIIYFHSSHSIIGSNWRPGSCNLLRCVLWRLSLGVLTITWRERRLGSDILCFESRGTGSDLSSFLLPFRFPPPCLFPSLMLTLTGSSTCAAPSFAAEKNFANLFEATGVVPRERTERTLSRLLPRLIKLPLLPRLEALLAPRFLPTALLGRKSG